MRRRPFPAAVVLAATLLLASACGSSDDKAGAQPSSSTTAATKLINYEDAGGTGGVAIKKAADVVKLKGAPEDFKAFIAGIIDYASNSTEPSKECPAIVTVSRIDPAGFASGGFNMCDGYAFIWAKVDGVWQQIDAGQMFPACESMKKYSVPKTIVGDQCAQDSGNVDYTG